MEKQLLKRLSIAEKRIVDLYHKTSNPSSEGGGSGAKVAQVEITQADILNPSGFLKVLVPSTVNKIKIPISLAIYRKPGGTDYSSPGFVRLNTIIGSNASTVGNTIFGTSIGSTEGSYFYNLPTQFNVNLSPNNNLSLVSGTAPPPSTISGGTGDLIAYITYIEIDTN
jgi:hypothetical protein